MMSCIYTWLRWCDCQQCYINDDWRSKYIGKRMPLVSLWIKLASLALVVSTVVFTSTLPAVMLLIVTFDAASSSQNTIANVKLLKVQDQLPLCGMDCSLQNCRNA